ncbi:MAG TPA: hypothetical protein VJN92_19365 [Candidatus Acidoferrum sp.]|nr:hypothetical protein [Candidatus Acidoferrum sp.]
MTNVKQRAPVKSVVRVAVILVLLVVPASLLAWFCGTGRMTGGGKLLQCTSDGATCVDITGATSPTNAGVTNGYELHCDGSLPNNLEINDHLSNGFHFHLDNLMTANCFDDGLASPNPPAANFDVFVGQGNGTWSNGSTKAPACAEWYFVDHGSGHSSSSYIRITDTPNTATDFCPSQTTPPNTCPGTQLLLVPYAPLLSGQNQAHK